MDIKDEDGRYHGLPVIHVMSVRSEIIQTNQPIQTDVVQHEKKAAPHPNFTQNANVVCPKLLY